MYPSHFRRWTLFSIIILLAGAAWIAVSRISPNAITSGAIPAPRQGFLAPDFALKEPVGRIEQALLFLLAGPAYITGEILYVDGGRYLI